MIDEWTLEIVIAFAFVVGKLAQADGRRRECHPPGQKSSLRNDRSDWYLCLPSGGPINNLHTWSFRRDERNCKVLEFLNGNAPQSHPV
jgi:hypothetical protein